MPEIGQSGSEGGAKFHFVPTPILPAELLCDMEMQKVRQSHLPMPPSGQPHLERLFRDPDKALKYRADLSN